MLTDAFFPDDTLTSCELLLINQQVYLDSLKLDTGVGKPGQVRNSLRKPKALECKVIVVQRWITSLVLSRHMIVDPMIPSITPDYSQDHRQKQSVH